jgi:hypothetical protein
VLEIGTDTARLMDPQTPSEAKTLALKFLIHFVGDIHQPLHVSRWRDEGGSKIKGNFMGRQTNMHQVWDSGIIRNAGQPWREIADQPERKLPPSSRQRLTWRG